MGFDFEGTDAFTPSLTTLLPVGNHVAVIQSAGTGHSSGGYPQLEVEVANAQGTRRDWIVYGTSSDFGLRKLVGLFRAADVELSNADQTEDGLLTDEAAARLVGKKVGVLVREEEDRQNPGKKRERVRGYVPASEIEDDVPIITDGLGAGVVNAQTQMADDDIPF